MPQTVPLFVKTPLLHVPSVMFQSEPALVAYRQPYRAAETLVLTRLPHSHGAFGPYTPKWGLAFSITATYPLAGGSPLRTWPPASGMTRCWITAGLLGSSVAGRTVSQGGGEPEMTRWKLLGGQAKRAKPSHTKALMGGDR